jgi:hypothetical protein
MTKQAVLERLKKLVAKGYVVRWEESDQDTLRLAHPRAPDLTLFPEQRAVSTGALHKRSGLNNLLVG